MGLFDKIKDNAKTISMKAIEATREYDEEYAAEQQSARATASTPAPTPAPSKPAPKVVEEPVFEEAVIETPVTEVPKPAKPENKEEKPAPKAEGKPKEKEEAPKENKKTETKEEPRKSRVTEVPRSSIKIADGPTVKAKPAASGKPYTPSYKLPAKSDDDTKADTKTTEPAKTPAPRLSRIIDVTPGKITDPTKQAIYARERAALAALASQRKLNGTVALYVTQHLNFKTRVYVDRIEYSGSFGKNVVPIEQVAWVKLRAGGTGVIIETIEGKRIVMVIKPKDRLEFADAVLKVQAMQPKRQQFKDTKTVRIDQLEKFSEGVDELEKLAKLFDKGILSQEEFDTKKKQILGI